MIIYTNSFFQNLLGASPSILLLGIGLLIFPGNIDKEEDLKGLELTELKNIFKLHEKIILLILFLIGIVLGMYITCTISV